MKHTIIHCNDEKYCPKCKKRWGKDEEEPLCERFKAIKPEDWKKLKESL
jgi:hypothetical protein